MSTIKVGDIVVCINNKYDHGQKVPYLEVGTEYKVIAEQFNTIKIDGCSMWFAPRRFKVVEND